MFVPVALVPDDRFLRRCHMGGAWLCSSRRVSKDGRESVPCRNPSRRIANASMRRNRAAYSPSGARYPLLSLRVEPLSISTQAEVNSRVGWGPVGSFGGASNRNRCVSRRRGTAIVFGYPLYLPPVRGCSMLALRLHDTEPLPRLAKRRRE
jgi:hypothetical protein